MGLLPIFMAIYLLDYWLKVSSFFKMTYVMEVDPFWGKKSKTGVEWDANNRFYRK